MYTLREAAKKTGKSRPTIYRAIKNGLISGHQNERGQWLVDPAELHRIFPPVHDEQNTDCSVNQTVHPIEQHELFVFRLENEHLKATIEQLKQVNSGLEKDRDSWKEQAQRLLISPPQNGRQDNGFWYRVKAVFAG